MDIPEVKILIKNEQWGIKFYIDGKWIDFVDIMSKAEKWDRVAEAQTYYDTIEKVKAIESWWDVFNQTIDSPCAKDRLAVVLGFDG